MEREVHSVDRVDDVAAWTWELSAPVGRGASLVLRGFSRVYGTLPKVP